MILFTERNKTSPDFCRETRGCFLPGYPGELRLQQHQGREFSAGKAQLQIQLSPQNLPESLWLPELGNSLLEKPSSTNLGQGPTHEELN